MLLRDPCKKCIVRACCTIECRDKKEQVFTREVLLSPYYGTIYRVDCILTWFEERDWWEIIGIAFVTVFGLSVVAIGILGG